MYTPVQTVHTLHMWWNHILEPPPPSTLSSKQQNSLQERFMQLTACVCFDNYASEEMKLLLSASVCFMLNAATVMYSYSHTGSNKVTGGLVW